MEDEKWDQWEESKIAHDWIADEEPLTDSEYEDNISDSSDGWANRCFAKATVFQPTYEHFEP